jgi:hypothetical protein
MKPKPLETATKAVLAGVSAASLGLNLHRVLSGMSPETLILTQTYFSIGLAGMILAMLVFLAVSDLNRRW